MNLDDLINRYPVTQWVIWVGAGISADPPSSLPLGLPLTRFAIDICCGQAVRERIENLWQQINRQVGTPENPDPLGALPRLESVLGDIDDVGTQAIGLKFDFLLGFQSFIDTPFNANHLAVAQLLDRGATVITTNFDTCIEKAFRFYNCRVGDPEGVVHHLHGTVADLREFGATIRLVKRGLREDDFKYLDHLFSFPCLILFLGYSASDSFDINLYFSEKSERQYGESTAAFLQHHGSRIPSNANFLVRPFGTRWLGAVDTSAFLHSLAPTSLPHSSESSDWKERFLSCAVRDDISRVRAYLTCKVAFTLGVDVDLLDPYAYRGALATKMFFDSLSLHKTLAYVCRIQGKAKMEKQHDLSVKKTDADLLGYYYAHGHFRRALKYSHSVQSIIDSANATQAELDWSLYVSMAAHCRLVIMKYFRNPFARKLSKSDKLKIRELLEVTRVLSSVKFKNVRFVIQVATALRFNFLLKALLEGVDGEPQVNQILRLYGEASSVAGFISTYRDLAIQYFLLTKFHGIRKMEHASQAIAKSLELAKLVGDDSSIKRAKTMIRYFSLFRWSW
jgi:SIR2-like domain